MVISKIIHIDMDCFYAAVEILDRPDLADKPVAVGGRPEGRGVLTTCNYVARKFGVRSALSSREAIRRCPNLVILPPRFTKYKAISQQVQEIFKQFTDRIEPVSLDEAYLDVSYNKDFKGSATEIAREIRKQIFEKTGLTASAGIANNKFLAKVASDWKKPNGQFTIAPEKVSEFIKDLPVKKIPGVGKVTQQRLEKLNISTCTDLQALELSDLHHHFGSFGDRLYFLSRGIDHSRVKSERVRKSISVENTFSQDILDWPDVEKQIVKLYQELEFRMQKAKIDKEQLKSQAVKFKFDDFSIRNHERVAESSDLKSFIDLARAHYQNTGEPIRLIGIGFKLKSKTKPKRRGQLALFKEDTPDIS